MANNSSTSEGLARAEELLREAAKIAAAHDVAPEGFTNAAMTAFFAECPELREKLELQAVAAELEALRARGRVGQA